MHWVLYNHNTDSDIANGVLDFFSPLFSLFRFVCIKVS